MALYVMPTDLGTALEPRRADPASPAQLAESALYLLNPDQAGGPDYLGAARICLLAAEVADPEVERDLRHACYRVAARSALRAGDRELYLEAVELWEGESSRVERESGELRIHRTMRDELRGAATGRRNRLPSGVARLLPPVTEDFR
jgi:hypothetical protein